MTDHVIRPRRSPDRPVRGRPKDPDKRAAILDAAKRLFARHGLVGVSMDTLAQAAGVSKLTLYSHFDSKEQLFQQAVTEKCHEHTPPHIFDAQAPMPLRQRLLTIGSGFVDLMMSREAIDLQRMMEAQAASDSRLGKLFYAAGPARVLAQFSAVLEAASKAGELAVDNPHEAAAHFFTLLKGIHHMRVMVGAQAPPGRAARKAHVESVVRLFLRAYRP